ncbi:hypothetical protein [Mucilaginibacter agri]|uniref:Uncharacterized protein n=1 Tax=Mucilaginibacter agri TaxID=2695265 RepID=A0A965ZMF4_9SPHI|nr:hypothetical protein [Mucilaginibacter agri]NCD72391.1 hypothetical protein [Mucilaginibacter agri]
MPKTKPELIVVAASVATSTACTFVADGGACSSGNDSSLSFLHPAQKQPIIIADNTKWRRCILMGNRQIKVIVNGVSVSVKKCYRGGISYRKLTTGYMTIMIEEICV